jgi:hypothetical protein
MPKATDDGIFVPKTPGCDAGAAAGTGVPVDCTSLISYFSIKLSEKTYLLLKNKTCNNFIFYPFNHSRSWFKQFAFAAPAQWVVE